MISLLLQTNNKSMARLLSDPADSSALCLSRQLETGIGNSKFHYPSPRCLSELSSKGKLDSQELKICIGEEAGGPTIIIYRPLDAASTCRDLLVILLIYSERFHPSYISIPFAGWSRGDASLLDVIPRSESAITSPQPASVLALGSCHSIRQSMPQPPHSLFYSSNSSAENVTIVLFS